MALNKELVAASATPLILSILKQSDSYGYEIIQQVNQLSAGDMAWADGMLYPILHRLEKKQLIESYWELSDSGRRRKYYRITGPGARELQTQRENWRKLSAMLDRLEEK
ncbi:MAG: PadR family transcriptional regulator [Gammaproteobacteria bacterium]|nr:PadR family transcriptional regulator [Gammaproteobacteria bacterium]